MSQKNAPIKILFSLLAMALFWVSLKAHARPLNVRQSCIDQMTLRMNRLHLPPQTMGRIGTETQCLEKLISLYNPEILLRKDVHLDDFSCRPWGKRRSFKSKALCEIGETPEELSTMLAVDYFNFLAGEEAYAEIIKDSLTLDDIEMMEDYQDGGINAIVSKSYQNLTPNFLGYNLPFTRGFNLRGIKEVLVDFTEHYFIATLASLKITDEDGVPVQKLAQKYSKNLQQCFKAVRLKRHLDYCVDQLTEFAAADLGEDILSVYLKRFFLSKVQKNYHSGISKASQAEFRSCLVNYYFDEDIKTPSMNKIKACVYSAMFTGFKTVAKVTISPHLNDIRSNVDVDDIVDGALFSCEKGDLISPGLKTSNYYDHLSTYQPDDIESIALSCQENAETHSIKEIARATIIHHPDIRGFLGYQSEELAEYVLTKYLPLCAQRMTTEISGGRLQDCGAFLKGASVFAILEKFGEQKVHQLLKEMGNIQMREEHIESVVEDSIEALSDCRENVFDELIKNHEMTEEDSELLISFCLSKGIQEAVSGLSGSLIKEKISENAVIEKYKIQLGPQKMDDLLSQFNNCFTSHLTEFDTINGLLNGLESSMNDCQLEITKEVTTFVIDRILLQELQRTGISESQVQKIIDNYKAQPENLYHLMASASSLEEIDKLSETADQRVVEAVAYDVVYVLIEKETGSFLSGKRKRQYAELGAEMIIECSQEGELKDCQEQVTPEIMTEILIEVLPGEVAAKFDEASQGVLSRQQRRVINVKKTVKWWITPNPNKPDKQYFNTNVGANLIKYMVSQLVKGKAVDEIQDHQKVRESIFVILSSSRDFFGRMVKTLIQPELDKKEVETRNIFRWIIVSKEAFIWDKIKETPSGQAVFNEMKRILRKVVVEKRSFTAEDEEIIVELVTQAVKEYGRG